VDVFIKVMQISKVCNNIPTAKESC
jgi:hypothetical protein